MELLTVWRRNKNWPGSFEKQWKSCVPNTKGWTMIGPSGPISSASGWSKDGQFDVKRKAAGSFWERFSFFIKEKQRMEENPCFSAIPLLHFLLWMLLGDGWSHSNHLVTMWAKSKRIKRCPTKHPDFVQLPNQLWVCLMLDFPPKETIYILRQ